MTFWARFDGKVFVPEGDVKLAKGSRVRVEVPAMKTGDLDWRLSLDAFLAGAVPGVVLSEESLRREHLYD